MNFDANFEDAILSQCLKDVSFLKKACGICEAHVFCTKERSWLWKLIHGVWTKNKEVVTKQIVAVKALEEFKDSDNRKPYLALAKKIFRTEVENPKSVLDELEKFVRYVNIHSAIEKSYLLLEKDDVQAAEKVISQHIRNISRQRKYTHVRWLEEFGERQKQRKYERDHPNEFITIPLGFPSIDKVLSGGGRKGELGLVIGTTGRGKSCLLTNIAMSCVLHGYKALYCGFEMPARQLATRQDSRWSGLEYRKFKKYDFIPSEIRLLEKRCKKALRKMGNKLHIVSMPLRTANIWDVRNALEDLYQEYNFRPDAIIMDSADHLMSLDKYNGQYRLQQAEVYWAIKGLAEEDGYFVISSTQAGKEWVSKVATSESSSESYDKSRIADLILSINDPFEMKRSGRKTIISEDDEEDDSESDEEIEYPVIKDGSRAMELYVAKYRDGDSKFKVDIECDLQRILMKEKGIGIKDDN